MKWKKKKKKKKTEIWIERWTLVILDWNDEAFEFYATQNCMPVLFPKF